MFSIYQCILYGKMIPAEKHISESKLSQKLACHGDAPKVPVFGEVLCILLHQPLISICVDPLPEVGCV